MDRLNPRNAIGALAIGICIFAAVAASAASLGHNHKVNTQLPPGRQFNQLTEETKRAPLPPPPPPDMPHPVIQRDLTLTDMKVSIEINGAVAKTTIRQTLRNDGSFVAEGEYMLPLPQGASVTDFALIDGDQRLTPKILPAKEARQIYEEIVRKMRDPGLLEYVNNSCFSVHVFPFAPGATRSVEISFSQALGGTTDLSSYNLPLRWAGWSRLGDMYGSGTNFTLTYSINSAFPLGTVSSPTFGLSVNRDGELKASGSYEGKVSSFGSDFVLNIGRRTGPFGASLQCFPGDPGEEGYFILSLLAAMPQDQKAIAKDVVFIFDKSGSMDGNKIVQAKAALRFVIGRLNSEDHFNVLYYSDAVSKVFEGLRPASGDNIAAARGEVEKLTADGGTDINSALGSAAQMFMQPSKQANRPKYAIFLTDGQPTVGEVSVDKIISNAQGSLPADVKLFVFGVGNDVNTTLLDSLSYEHHGTATYVSEQEDIEVKVSQFYARMSSPALTNLVVSLEGLDERDMMPRELPDLFHNTELFITGRYSGRPAETVKLAVSGKGEGGVDKTLSATISSNVSSANNQVPRLWAARKVSWLLDQIRLKGDNKELLSEVDRLATRFGIVTPYTSYLITEPGMYFDRDARAGSLEGQLAVAREDEAGAAAVGRSKQSQVNQDAVNAAAPQSAGQAAGGADDSGFVVGSQWRGSAEEYEQKRRQGNADPAQMVNYVNEQTFVQQKLDGDRIQWVDARIDQAQNARRVKLTTYSEAYFRLIAEHPELADYLSQGESVVLWLSDSLLLETTVEEVSTPQADLDELEQALK